MFEVRFVNKMFILCIIIVVDHIGEFELPSTHKNKIGGARSQCSLAEGRIGNADFPN